MGDVHPHALGEGGSVGRRSPMPLTSELPPIHQIAVAWLAMGAGAFVQGSLGFGAALVAAPVLALVDPRTVPASMLAVTVLLAAMTATRDRRSLSFRLGWALVGRVPGTLVGALALAVLSERALGLLFATLVLAAVTLSLSGMSVGVRRATLVAAGVMSGVMGTVASMGGPPLALLYQREPGPKLRADLAGYFFVGVIMSLAAVTVVGRFGRHEAIWATLLAPPVVLGFLLSGRAVGKLDAGHTRQAVLAVSTVTALAVIGKHLVPFE